MKTFLLKVLLVVFSAGNVILAADYYVSENGSDADPGSITAPFATIQKAANTMNPGDTCFIRGGTYRETVNLTRSGQEGKWIKFTAYKAEKVTLDGTENLNLDWTVQDENIYKAQTDKQFDQLFVDGKMMVEARWPNIQSPDGVFKKNTWAYVDSASLGTLTDTALVSSGITDWSGGYGVFNISQQMHNWPRQVLSQSGNTITYDTTNINEGLNASFNDDRYYLFGKLQALDIPGEWFLDTQTGTAYLWTKQNDSPANHTIAVKQRDYGFEAEPGTEYIELKGLNFFGCEFQFPQFCHYITIDDCHLRYSNYSRTIPPLQIGGSMYLATPHLAGHHLTFKNSSIAHCLTNGIYFLGSHVTATNNLLYDTNWNGSNMFSAMVVATRSDPNTIYGQGHSLASDNTIYNTGNVAIKFRHPNSTAQYNDLSQGGLSAKDTTLLYSAGTYPNAIYQYNWLHDNIGWHGNCLGFRLDGNPGKAQTEKATVRGNVVWNTSGRGFVIKGLDHRIYNNTVLGEINLIYDSHQQTKIYNNYAKSFTFTRDATKSEVGFFSNNSTASDPKLTNPENMNFTPSANSQLIDAGTASPNDYHWDWTAPAPDIGAYERNAEPRRTPGYKSIRAHTPKPEDQAEITGQTVTLTWQSPNLGKGAAQEKRSFLQNNSINLAYITFGQSYDIYFGTSLPAVSSADSNSPEFIKTQTDTSCEIKDMSPNTTYYWRIDNRDQNGNLANYGHIWSFTTSN